MLLQPDAHNYQVFRVRLRQDVLEFSVCGPFAAAAAAVAIFSSMTDKCRSDICWCYYNLDAGCPTSAVRVIIALVIILVPICGCSFCIYKKCCKNEPQPVMYVQQPAMQPGGAPIAGGGSE